MYKVILFLLLISTQVSAQKTKEVAQIKPPYGDILVWMLYREVVRIRKRDSPTRNIYWSRSLYRN